MPNFKRADILRQRDIAIDILARQIGGKHPDSIVAATELDREVFVRRVEDKLNVLGERDPNHLVVIDLLIERLLAQERGRVH